MPGVFQDEAEISPAGGREAVNYTPALFTAFQTRWGYDLRPNLVSLFERGRELEARPARFLRHAARSLHRELGQALLRLRHRQRPGLHRALLGTRVAHAARLPGQPGHGRLRPHARHRHPDERVERRPVRPVRQRPGRPGDPQRGQPARPGADPVGDLRRRRLGHDLRRPEEDRRLGIRPGRQFPQPAPVLRHDQGRAQARPPAVVLGRRTVVALLQHPGRLFRPAVRRHEPGRAGQPDPGHRADDDRLDVLFAVGRVGRAARRSAPTSRPSSASSRPSRSNTTSPARRPSRSSPRSATAGSRSAPGPTA